LIRKLYNPQLESRLTEVYCVSLCTYIII